MNNGKLYRIYKTLVNKLIFNANKSIRILEIYKIITISSQFAEISYKLYMEEHTHKLITSSLSRSKNSIFTFDQNKRTLNRRYLFSPSSRHFDIWAIFY